MTPDKQMNSQKNAKMSQKPLFKRLIKDFMKKLN